MMAGMGAAYFYSFELHLPWWVLALAAVLVISAVSLFIFLLAKRGRR